MQEGHFPSRHGSTKTTSGHRLTPLLRVCDTFLLGFHRGDVSNLVHPQLFGVANIELRAIVVTTVCQHILDSNPG